MVAEKFQIYGVKITCKYICESKNWISSFLVIPPSKTLPQFFIITHPHPFHAEGNYPFLPNSVFWRSKIYFSPAERGEERIIELKKLPKFNLRGYWLQVLINSTIFATFQSLQVSSLSFTKQINWQPMAFQAKLLSQDVFQSHAVWLWNFPKCYSISALYHLFWDEYCSNYKQKGIAKGEG